MNYQANSMTGQVSQDQPEHDTRAKRSRDWYNAEFARLGGLGDVKASYALLQKAKQDHGDLWASFAHFTHFDLTMMDRD